MARRAETGLVLDALEQALHARRPVEGGLVHHSDRGVQYVSIAYTERLAEAGIAPSVGGVGDSYDCEIAGRRPAGLTPVTTDLVSSLLICRFGRAVSPTRRPRGQ